MMCGELWGRAEYGEGIALGILMPQKGIQA